MTVFKVIFWFSLFIVFYSYIGYGILIAVLVWLKRRFSHQSVITDGGAFEPEVTIVVSAFNEEDFIERKIHNTFELNYPPSKLKVIFITDGSTDNTPALIKKHERIELLHQP